MMKHTALVAGLALFLVAAVLGRAAAASHTNGTTGLPDSFVSVKGGRLVIGPSCQEFFFAGWNHWEESCQGHQRAAGVGMLHISPTYLC